MSRLSILTAGLAVLLAGCATAPEPPQSPAELRSTHGFLRASLATGKDKPEPLKLRRISDGITVKLQAQPAHGRWSVGLWLPEGEYEFPSLVQANGQKYSPIRVERGRVTDLGAVLDLQVGGYEYLTVAIDHPEASADLDAALRELQPHLSNMEPLKWSTPSPPKPQTIPTPTSSLGLVADLLLAFERHVNKPPLRERLKEAKTASEAYRLALTGIAPDTDEPGIDAAGALYFGGALGQIRRRSPNGEWTSLDTGTLESITAVEVDGNRLMAGTSSGTIRVSDDGGVTWRRLVTLDVGLPVVDIDRVGLRWIVSLS